MKDKKRAELINNIQKDINEYWFNVTADDIITIRTRAFDGPYVRREAEKFTAIKLPNREIPGLGQSIRCIRLDSPSVTIQNVPLDWIDSINGKPLRQQTEWEIKGSKGNIYKVNLKGDRYVCTCPGFVYRKHCKHVEEIKNAKV